MNELALAYISGKHEINKTQLESNHVAVAVLTHRYELHNS